MKLFSFAVVISMVCRSSLGFSASSQSAVPTTKSALFANPLVSRKRAFQDVIATTVATVTIGTALPTPALAVRFGGIDATPEESLRYVKRAIKAIEKIELSVTNNEYEQVKDSLRSPSVDTLRKYCNVLITSREGAEKDDLTALYQKFIKDFETLDSQAGLGVRGNKNAKMYEPYRASLSDLVTFSDTAEKMVGVASESTATSEVASE